MGFFKRKNIAGLFKQRWEGITRFLKRPWIRIVGFFKRHWNAKKIEAERNYYKKTLEQSESVATRVATNQIAASKNKKVKVIRKGIYNGSKKGRMTGIPLGTVLDLQEKEAERLIKRCMVAEYDESFNPKS